MADEVLKRVQYRPAKAGDVDALRELFDRELPQRYPQEFYDDLRKAIASAAPRFLVHIAADSGHLAGAVVLALMNLAEARAGGQLPCELLDAPSSPGALGACVLLLAVWPKYRRLGIGSELLFEGISAAAQGNEAVRAVFLHARGDEAGKGIAAFYEENDFACVGAIPRHYKLDGKPVDALLYARGLRDPLVEYQPQAPGRPPVLTDAGLARVRRTPKWAKDLCLHFLLPALAVVLLFLISYALVQLGPLKGIGDLAPPRPPAATPTPTPTSIYRDSGGAHEL